MKPGTEKYIQIKGRVVDENGDGIPYASVLIKGTKTGTSCDSDGNFQLSPGVNKKSITLVTTCIGFIPVEKNVDISSGLPAEIIIQSNPSVNGEVVVASSIYMRGRVARMGAYSVRKKVSAFQKIKNVFINDSVSVYPNPSKSGNTVNIKWLKKETGEYSFDLYTLHGQLMSSETNQIETKNQIIPFRLVSVTPGTYFLRMTNKKSGKQHTEKIIVQ